MKGIILEGVIEAGLDGDIGIKKIHSKKHPNQVIDLTALLEKLVGIDMALILMIPQEGYKKLCWKGSTWNPAFDETFAPKVSTEGKPE